MNVVVLAVIGLVLLAGLVAAIVGNRGWSWGTVVAAILVMLSAAGYIYLAARLGERERSWRARVNRTEAEIARIRDGGGGKPSLADLRTQRSRWTRALEFVDTWHGRTWKAPRFSPPRAGRPGTVSMELPNDDTDVAPLGKGAEIAVFERYAADDAENQGRFLGIFRVQEAVANRGSSDCLVTVLPADAPAAPSPSDQALWNRDFEDVVVYESLPVDRWLAFYRIAETPQDRPEATGPARWMPQPRKEPAAAAPLEKLERQMEAFGRHDEEVPEDQWADLGTRLAAHEIPPGNHWATIEFTENARFTRKGGFALDAGGGPAAAEAPAAPPGEDDDGPIGAPGEMVEPGAMITPGDAAESDEPAGDPGADPTLASPAGVITKRFKERRFEKGTEAEFDLQTALELQNDRQWAKIKRVRYRRPLTDPFTFLRGANFPAQGDAAAVRSEGVFALKQGLTEEIAEIDQGTARVQRARENVDAQSAATGQEKTQLEQEITSWDRDVAAADDVATAFNERLRAATLELAALEKAIVRLGRELAASSASLTRAVDAVAP
jgi:hypothetical protein